MTTWEYDRIRFGVNLTEVRDNQVRILNEQGTLGWELVTIADNGYTGIFKRLKTEATDNGGDK